MAEGVDDWVDAAAGLRQHRRELNTQGNNPLEKERVCVKVCVRKRMREREEGDGKRRDRERWK